MPHPSSAPSLWLLWFSPAPFEVVVDRIEPPMAVLEWPSGDVCDLPLDLLPPNLSEGERLRVTLQRGRGGLALRAARPQPLPPSSPLPPVSPPLTAPTARPDPLLAEAID